MTGGCGGMGLGVGEYFAQQGIGVVLVDKSVAPGQALAAKYPGLVQLIEIDLANHALVNERLGPLLAADDAPEVLINGAGWSPKYDAEGKPWKPWTMPLEHWQLVMGINVDATFNMCRLALPAMVKRKYGRIVNIASLAARTGGGVAPVHYVTSKAALLGMTKAIAKDVKTEGLSDAAIRKAVVAAKLGDAAIADKADAYIDARFDILVEDAKKANPDPFAATVRDGISTPTNDDAASKAYAAMLADMQSAHLPKTA